MASSAFNNYGIAVYNSDYAAAARVSISYVY